ncbi:MAG: OmpA family protein [Propioniciclava sp.]
MTWQRQNSRGLSAVAAAALILILGAPAAWADWIDRLPAVDANTVTKSVRLLKPMVNDIELPIRDLVGQRQDGEEKVIDISSDVMFAFDSDEVKPKAVEKLPELLKPIPQGAEVLVHGHTDGIGSDEYNQDLSERRAKAAAAEIQKVRPDLSLDIEGFGETKPLKPEKRGGKDDPAARAENRRVEIRYRG